MDILKNENEEIQIENQINQKKEEKEKSKENKNKSNNPIDYNLLNNNSLINTNRENEYKNLIKELEKEIEKEKKKSKNRSEDNKILIAELNKKIVNCEREIKYYSNKNQKQIEKLELFSGEITNKINKININDFLKKIENSKKNIKNKREKEKEIVDDKLGQKEKQLKNIMVFIKNNESENESLKNKLIKYKKGINYNDLLKLQKEEENKILNLQKEIKMKKTQLEEHLKCNLIKSNLIRKIEDIRHEITMFNKIYEQTKNKINILEYKNKPKIISDKKINNTIDTSKIKKPLNIKSLNISNAIDNKINNQIYKIKYKKNNSPSPKRISAENENEEELIEIPFHLSQIFSEKELKAIFVGLDKNKYKYKKFLKILNIKSSIKDSIESKHKLDIKQRLNKINELDEQIEYMNIKNGENEVDIELIKKQINDLNKEKNIYLKKNNQLNNQIKEKNIINEVKDKEINSLGKQLIQLKNFLKKGDIESIKKFPEIEIQYFDENEDNSFITKILKEI